MHDAPLPTINNPLKDRDPIKGIVLVSEVAGTGEQAMKYSCSDASCGYQGLGSR